MDSSRLSRQEADIKQQWLFSHRGITSADPCEATETLSLLITKTARSHSLEYRCQLGMKGSFSISHEGERLFVSISANKKDLFIIPESLTGWTKYCCFSLNKLSFRTVLMTNPLWLEMVMDLKLLGNDMEKGICIVVHCWVRWIHN